MLNPDFLTNLSLTQIFLQQGRAVSTERSIEMIKVAYFLFRYSEPTTGRNFLLPQELRGFTSRKTVLDACYSQLADGRTLKRFSGSVEGDIGGFRNWEAGNRPDHPHSGVLRQYIEPHDQRERLWNEIKRFFSIQEATPAGSAGEPASNLPRSVSTAASAKAVKPVLPEPDELLNDDAEFAVQNLRQEVEVRQKQSVFRKRVLDNFGSCCCISGISEPCMLVASHIVPWSKRTDSRLNPCNGLLLNVLYDKLFDRGLITFSDELVVIVIDWADQCSVALQQILFVISGKRASRPKKMPRPEFLEFHREHVFKKRPNQDALM